MCEMYGYMIDMLDRHLDTNIKMMCDEGLEILGIKYTIKEEQDA